MNAFFRRPQSVAFRRVLFQIHLWTGVGGMGVLLLGTGPLQVSRSGRGAYEASLTVINDGFAASWYDTRDGHAEIYMRLLDARGRPAGPERRLTKGTDSAYEPDIAALNGRLAIAWYEKNPSTGRLRAKLGLFARDGKVVWSQTLSALEHDGRNPVVRAVGDDLFCAWLEGSPNDTPALVAAWFDAAGRALSPARRVAPAGRTTWNLNAAVDESGTAWVAFDATAGTRRDELFLARVDRTAATVTTLTSDDGFESKYPALAFDADRVALTWFDERDGNQEVYLFVGSRAEMTGTLDARGRRVTTTAGESIGAYLTWNRQRVGLAWCDNTSGQHDIYFREFGADGVALHDARRLTDNSTSSLIPAIKPWRDGFAILWNEFAPGRGGPHAHDGRSEVVLQLIEE